MTRALLMSSSRKDNLGYLEHADSQLRTILDGTSRKVLFIPYAAVSFSYDVYEDLASPAFTAADAELTSIHHADDPASAVENADVIAVGGGNSFALLKRLYDAGLVDRIRERVRTGRASYIGWSAGTNVATPSIRTTNDMPIVEPPTLSSIGLVPFQINPHFIPGKPAGHNGESREERLLEFTTINPAEDVLALYEGGALYVDGGDATVLGDRDALVFSHDADPRTIDRQTSFALADLKGPVN
ncbi:dipeptidase PepE [Corynebacterium sp. USCH3]|uniref:dipeptidase PepE n=1 Tax=Corynebacterium sp. USCH3 TaxID=3024840 RepID=UPI00309E90C5